MFSFLRILRFIFLGPKVSKQEKKWRAFIRMKRVQRIMENQRQQDQEREKSKEKRDKDKQRERPRDSGQKTGQKEWGKQIGTREKTSARENDARKNWRTRTDTMDRAATLRERVKQNRQKNLDLWSKMQ